MTVSGWIFLILAWSAILGLFLYALLRTLRSGKNNTSSSQNREIRNQSNGQLQSK